MDKPIDKTKQCEHGCIIQCDKCREELPKCPHGMASLCLFCSYTPKPGVSTAYHGKKGKVVDAGESFSIVRWEDGTEEVYGNSALTRIER